MTTLDIGVYGARGVPSTYSGYETFLTTLLPELVLRGHRVTAYCRAGESIESGPWQGVERVLLPALPGKNTSTLSHGLVASIAARRAGHDVVLAVNVANAVYTAIGRLTGQPTVLNTDGQEWDRGKWGTVAQKVFRGSARIAGRCATGLVADCRAMHDVYTTEFQSPSTIIPYCAPTIDWEPDPESIDDLGVVPGSYLVIAGRHNPENNIHLVAQAIAESDLDLPLLVLGTANYDSPVTVRLEELARDDDRVRLVGHVGSRDTFLDVMHHATAYVHGHSVGGINPSIIEAMYVGARVIAFDTPFNREVLGNCGLFFRLDPSDLIEKIEIVRAESTEDRGDGRDAAADRIASTYSVKTVVDAYESLLLAGSEHARATELVITTRW